MEQKLGDSDLIGWMISFSQRLLSTEFIVKKRIKLSDEDRKTVSDALDIIVKCRKELLEGWEDEEVNKET